MVQINMRVFKIISLLLLSILSGFDCSPVSSLRLEHRGGPEEDSGLALDNYELQEPSSTTKPVEISEDTYDQRQNGTENYRIHVDGLVVVVAPVEALLLAGGIPDNFSNILAPPPAPEKPLDKPLDKPQEDEGPLKPVDKPIEGEKPLDVKKISHRGHLKLVSFLAPLLRHIGQQ
ncbi:uncharacterized protein LOC107037548 [Diachasma alloeum]|uniref:uncharacterized protein LOC107037548 n=1 Tax=Diachasma alloeum TaxID=454923 RepID=UPI0007382E42|nr:uncharacterized protein LOC107037548 [Diachasma alloeum]